jgi:hypothetical protein
VPPNPFAEVLVKLRLRCERELQEANESGIQGELEDLKLQEGALKVRIALCVQEIEDTRERVAVLLAQRSRPAPKGYARAEIVAVWPLAGEYTPADRVRMEEQQTTLEEELRQLEEQELKLSQQLQTGGRKLDLEEARRRREQQERSYQTRKRGNLMLQATTKRMLRKMLPRIEYYMQQFLPALTVGRYHDLRLATEPDEQAASGGPLQLSVWEPAASAYIPRAALSSGTADQISLALRLAFAVAALPRELSAAPGFVLLDEPLTSSSRERIQALVDIITGETLGQHFEQVLFISHNSAFDPAMFNHHVYVEDGLVSESSLPVDAPLAPTTPLPDSTDLDELDVAVAVEEDEDENDGSSTSKVPIALPIAE